MLVFPDTRVVVPWHVCPSGDDLDDLHLFVNVGFCEREINAAPLQHKEELQQLQRQLEEREAELRRLKEESRPRLEGGDRGECAGVHQDTHTHTQGTERLPIHYSSSLKSNEGT